uniref:Methylmalonic aciduria and homocystinuria type D protein, mitochondrial n=2 Tax=Arion vulgaris TaxID=1028688 RepID=A0A0B7B8R0_9EUPU
MATKLVKCSRVVTYLPNLRSAVIRCRAFSSTTDTSDIHTIEPDDETAKSQTVWPDNLLGPLGPQDKRFPLPGSIGPCVTSRVLSSEINVNILQPSVFDPDSVLPKLSSQQQADIAEQFLDSLDEIDVDFMDTTISSPTASDKMEYRAHSCPTLLRKEFRELFPDRNIMEGDLTVVTISLKTVNDMTLWSSEVEREREEMLEIFIQGSLEICQAFEDSGYWADFIDPGSGKPFKGPHTNFTLFETDERYRKLGFEIQDLGCCKVISHPVWGTRSYIGCLFTSASIDNPLVTNINESR